VKIEPLAAGDDRCGELLRLGGREYKEDVLRGLLQRFEQRVERGSREHMNFVDDKHAAVELERGVLRALDKVAHVADAVVAGRVDFRNVRSAFRGAQQAGFALAAGFALFGRKAVDRAGEDARRAGFARAARAAEQIGVRRTIRRHLVFQRCGDMILPDDFRKDGGSVLAVERAVGHECVSPDLYSESMIP
jgi:hypothetical protein